MYAENVVIGPTKSGITLKGESGAILDGSTLGDGDGITLQSGVSDVTIKQFEIRNYKGPTCCGVGNAIQAWNRGTSRVRITNNNMHDNSWNAILVGNEGEGYHLRWSVKDNIVSNNGFYNIELTNAQDSEIKGNTVTGPGTGGSVGILVQARNFDAGYLGLPLPPATVTSAEIKVSDNEVSGFATSPYGMGIYLLAFAGSGKNAVLTDVKVSENEVTGNRLGIYVGNFSGGVTNSKIAENTVNGNWRGIVLYNGDANKIEENTANNNTEYGIRLIGDSTSNTISENTATGNGTFDLFHDGTSTPNTWTDNTCGTKSGADIPAC